MAGKPKWDFEAEYIQSCNCDFGCPCNFNGYPTFGNCVALVAYRIRKGKFGNAKLDGATFAAGFWWPAAIHEGNGTARIYFDTKVTAEQKAALLEILSGKVGGGFFEVLPKTLAKVHPPKTTKVDFHFNGYDSWFAVDGVGEVRSEHIRNPVTKDRFEGSIVLPHGLAFKEAIVSSIKKWWMRDEDLLAYHTDRNGHVAVVKFTEAGVVG
jgi:hypothetical protein